METFLPLYLILLTLIALFMPFNVQIIIFILIVAYIVRSVYQSKEKEKENFANIANNSETISIDKVGTKQNIQLEQMLQHYKQGDRLNPFSNVLLTEIADDPNRKSAPPAFNLDVDDKITKNVKKLVQAKNHTIHNTNKQLYSSLWDRFELDQSNRVWYSTANTDVQPGDQAAFGQYLYGTMPSAKENTPEGDMQRVKDNFRYTLY